MTTRIPLTVIGGFLGAGKTTLLNQLLRSQPDRRVAILVNDFGSLNIDTELVASARGDTIALTNGCVCCAMGDDLGAALLRVLAAPRPFDAVLIEASGVSDPGRIAQLGQAAPELQLDGVIVLTDATAVLEQMRDPLLADTVLAQIRSADWLVLNKLDLVDAVRLRDLRAALREAAPGTPVLESLHGNIPFAVLSDATLQAAPPCIHHGSCDCDHGKEMPSPHGERFDSWCGRPRKALGVQDWIEQLRALPAGVLRLKGFVRSVEHGWSEVQLAGRRIAVRRAEAAPSAGPALVAIGLRNQLPVAQLDEWTLFLDSIDAPLVAGTE